MGRFLVLLGAVLVAFGSVLIAFALILKRGGLPGDIIIKREGFFFYFPITSAILVSLVLSVIFWILSLIIKRF
ncbi:MAG: DUF2905 domain-containing protein [candidate division WOR-3 bacterium]